MLSSYIYCVIAMCIAGVSAFSREDMSAIVIAVHPHIMACSKDNGMSEEKFKDAKTSKNMNDIDPCYLSCLFKGIGAVSTLDSAYRIESPDLTHKTELCNEYFDFFLTFLLKPHTSFIGFPQMNQQGNFDPDEIIKKSKDFLSEEDDRKNFEVIARTCAAVNEETVSDGENGCERAKLLMACIMKNKDDFFKEE